MSKAHYFIYGVLVGVIVVLGTLLVTRPSEMAYAQMTSDAGGMAVATGGGTTGQNGESFLWVLDSTGKHLAVYATEQGKAVKALGVRNITWDLMVPMQAEARQLADLNDLREAAEKAAKKGKDEDKGGKGGTGS